MSHEDKLLDKCIKMLEQHMREKNLDILVRMGGIEYEQYRK